jgi:hypothetical protein
MIKICIGLRDVKYSLFLSNLRKFVYFRQIFEKFPNIMKICPVGTELFHADGLTDMTKLIVTFHNFSNAPINSCYDVKQ